MASLNEEESNGSSSSSNNTNNGKKKNHSKYRRDKPWDHDGIDHWKKEEWK